MMDLVCFSHLRWDFVYQRPQHLLTRSAKDFRVIYVEEPIWDQEESYSIELQEENIYIVKFRLILEKDPEERNRVKRGLLEKVMDELSIKDYIFWYYTPMAIPFSKGFNPKVTVYDCMDELAAFKFAPSSLKENERNLLEKADVVFTGGYSLYEAKKNTHRNIHPFPSSIDTAHFNRARNNAAVPEDQANVKSPRFGFAGVIDERMDIALLEQVAYLKPDWQFVMIGPVVKIDPASLPRPNNIHYLGMKSYKELPAYLSGWDIGMIPFAINESTQFISPTKTPEYLAAGLPVISSAIKDVIRPYGEKKLVHIYTTPEEFIAAGEKELIKTDKEKEEWLQRADEFLSQNSWDKTWKQMLSLINQCLSENSKGSLSESRIYANN